MLFSLAQTHLANPKSKKYSQSQNGFLRTLKLTKLRVGLSLREDSYQYKCTEAMVCLYRSITGLIMNVEYAYRGTATIKKG